MNNNQGASSFQNVGTPSETKLHANTDKMDLLIRHTHTKLSHSKRRSVNVVFLRLQHLLKFYDSSGPLLRRRWVHGCEVAKRSSRGSRLDQHCGRGSPSPALFPPLCHGSSSALPLQGSLGPIPPHPCPHPCEALPPNKPPSLLTPVSVISLILVPACSSVHFHTHRRNSVSFDRTTVLEQLLYHGLIDILIANQA